MSTLENGTIRDRLFRSKRTMAVARALVAWGKAMKDAEVERARDRAKARRIAGGPTYSITMTIGSTFIDSATISWP